jgi:UDP-glucose 4-epimerase
MGSRGNVLVTGGAGFIGSHLAERLLRDGHTVTIIDDCTTGSLQNLAAIRSHPDVTIIQSAVSDCADLPVLCAQASFIFHLAAAVGVELVVQSPVRTIETNLQETEVLLVSASSSGTPVLLASTSEVYGKSSKPSFSEDDDLLIGPPTLGRWSYACSKLMDEFLAMAYHRERKLPIIIARLFNTVGPRQTGRYGMVLPRFVEAALRNEPLIVFGNGDQTRCFCHVNDTIEALVRLQNTPAAVGEVINIGSTEEISIADLARRVITLLNSKSEVRIIPYSTAYPPGFEDMPRRKPSIEKLRRITGFSPATPLDATITSVAQALQASPR